MCLTVLAYRTVPGTDLLLLSNRDEFYDRPTERLHRWDTPSGIVGGRDGRAGGSWLAVSVNGRLANVTNVREPGGVKTPLTSRGKLVVDFLVSDSDAQTFGSAVRNDDTRDGFNLLLWDGIDLVYASNRVEDVAVLGPGVYALSNGTLGAAWPKMVRARARLDFLLRHERLNDDDLMQILLDTDPAGNDELPSTGVGLEWERALSPAFIRTARYGTRASTIVRLAAGGGGRVDEFTHGAGESSIFHEQVTL